MSPTRLEHQKVVFAVIFYEVVLLDQLIARLSGFLNDDIFLDAVIFAIAVTINYADAGSIPKRLSQVLEQHYRGADFMIGFEYQDRIHAVRGQFGVIRDA